MNRPAFYVYFRNPNKLHGAFVERAAAERYAGDRGTVVIMTGNEIQCCRASVVAPKES